VYRSFEASWLQRISLECRFVQYRQTRCIMSRDPGHSLPLRGRYVCAIFEGEFRSPILATNEKNIQTFWVCATWIISLHFPCTIHLNFWSSQLRLAYSTHYLVTNWLVRNLKLSSPNEHNAGRLKMTTNKEDIKYIYCRNRSKSALVLKWFYRLNISWKLTDGIRSLPDDSALRWTRRCFQIGATWIGPENMKLWIWAKNFY